MEGLFFVALATVALAGALTVVVASDPFISALALILHFGSLGALYLGLHAPFVAVSQVIVYAGAVVVLFLFVIAYLGDRREIFGGGRVRLGWLRMATAVTATFVLGGVTWALTGGFAFDVFPQPADVPDEFGGARAVGEVFLTDYLLAFEVTSLVLLVAAIGGVALGLTGRARHRRMRELMNASSSDQYRRQRGATGEPLRYGSDRPATGASGDREGGR